MFVKSISDQGHVVIRQSSDLAYEKRIASWAIRTHIISIADTTNAVGDQDKR